MTGKRVVEKGKCFVCGQNTDFMVASDALLFRDAVCGFCGASKRNSDLSCAIIKTFGKDSDKALTDAIDDFKSLSICEAQSTGRIFECLSTLPGYRCFEFLDGVMPGAESEAGVRCEDLEQLTFRDNSVDLFITQDVLEHVADWQKAFKEIRRVLKPGGYHIFTVPIHEGHETVTRAKMIAGGEEIEYLKPQVMHGDPVRQGGSLVFTDFGEDIVELLDRHGMSTKTMVFSKWYKPEETTYIDGEGAEYDSFKESLKIGRLDKFFKYNSIVLLSKKEEMLFTGERFTPELDGQIAYEHLHRYSVACEYVSGKSVLDIASGEGYGSNLLSKTADSVIGVDISVEAVSHASAKYKYQKNLEYRAGSCTDIPCDDNLFDVVVSFETIEHITEHELMLGEVKRVLKPDGVLIISSPNKEIYLDDNEFHLKELDYDEFDSLLKSYFKNIEMIGQMVISASHMWFMDAESKGFRSYSGNSNGLVGKNTPPYEPMYFIALCSDLNGAILGTGEQSLFTDESGTLLKQVQQLQAHIADKEKHIATQEKHIATQERHIATQEKSIHDIYNSLSWRITAPLRGIGSLFHRDKGEEKSETGSAVTSSGIKAEETVDLIKFRNIDEFQSFLATGVVERRLNEEKKQAEQNRNKKSWHISGYCEACARETEFLVDWSSSDGALPNYRERVICKRCDLNNRQRFVLTLMKKFIEEVTVSRTADLYLYEMVTSIYRYASENFKGINLTGSEYLGFDKKTRRSY